MAYRRYVPIGVIHNSRRASLGTEGTERVQHHHHTSHPIVSVHADPLLAYLRLIAHPPLFSPSSDLLLSDRYCDPTITNPTVTREEIVSRQYRDGVAKREPVTVDRNFACEKPLIFPPNPYSRKISRRIYAIPPPLSSFILLSPLNDFYAGRASPRTKRNLGQDSPTGRKRASSSSSSPLAPRFHWNVIARNGRCTPPVAPLPPRVGVIGIGNKMLRFTSYREVYWAGKIGGPKKECPI